MNRREFIKRAVSTLAGLVAFGRPTLRGKTKEIPATLNNRSVFAPLRIHEYGISADNVQARIATLDQNDCPFEIHIQRHDCKLYSFEPTDTEIVLSLPDDESVTDRLDQFGQMLAEQRPKLAELPHLHYDSTHLEMEHILAANPGMSREDAFFQAVIEIAERTL